MATQFTAPRMGEGVEELTLVKWLKEEGDPVKELEPIVEVETDKVVTELPSPATGVVLKRLVEEGLPVKVGDLLAWIGEPGEAVPEKGSAAHPANEEAIKSAPRRTAQERGSEIPEVRRLHRKNSQERILEIPETRKPQVSIVSGNADITEGTEKPERDAFLSPLVKRMLEENKLDPNLIEGSGQNGRVTKQDVIAYLERQGATTNVGAHGNAPAQETPIPGERILPGLHPISSIRRTIAGRMIESLSTSAHVLTVMESDLTRVEAHRKLNKPLFAQDGVRLTLTAYFIAAIAAALKANPKVNSSWTEDGLLIHPEINIGMAVSLGEEGLIVPVIKNADTLSLLGIARQVNDLADRARTKKLLPEEVRGGTFSLTNHGMSGSLFASPIITQPQVGILGAGLVQKRAVVVRSAAPGRSAEIPGANRHPADIAQGATDDQGSDSIAIRPMVYLSFVFDHRVLDGEGADNFLGKVKDEMESWG